MSVHEEEEEEEEEEDFFLRGRVHESDGINKASIFNHRWDNDFSNIWKLVFALKCAGCNKPKFENFDKIILDYKDN